MKKFNMKWLTAIALAFCLTAGISGAMAYFTDTTSAQGGQAIKLGIPWEPKELVDETGKHLTVVNTGEVPLYVRAFVIGDETLIDGVEVKVSPKKEGAWIKDGTYWYYTEPLQPGDETSELTAEIKAVGTTLDEFNVVVSEEATRIIYEKDAGGNEVLNPNNSSYIGWSLQADLDTSYKGGK